MEVTKLTTLRIRKMTKDQFETITPEIGELDFVVDEEYEGGGGSSSRNIGEIISSTMPLVDAGLHLLDGSLIRGGGVYDDFVNYIAEKYKEDPTANYFMQPQTQINVTKVGNVKEENGILSGFSASNYAKLPQQFNPQNNPWEIVFKFKTPSSYGSVNYPLIGSGVTTGLDWQGLVMEISSTGYSRCFFSSNGSSWDIGNELIGSTYLTPDTTWFMKLQFTGTSYIVAVSTDGETWTTQNTVNSTTSIFVSSQPLAIGANFWNPQDTSYFTGSIDLNNCYININNQEWWTGVVRSTQTTYNVQTVGSLVNTDGILSNFSTTNYAMLPEAFNPGNNTWEIGIAFTTGNDVNTFQMLIADEHSYSGLELILQNSHFTLQSLRNDAHTAIFSETGTYTVLSNTTYFIKIRFTGSAYTLDYSLDGVSYINDITANSSETIDQLNLPLLGIDVAAPDDAKESPFLGSIDLKESYININGQRWWKGVSEGNFVQPNMTSNGILGGSTFAVTSVGNMISNTEPYYAFTRDQDYAYVGGATPSLIFYNPDPLKVSQLNIEWRSPSSENPHTINVNVYGSNDNETWIPLVSNIGDTNDGASYGSSYLLINLTNNNNYYKYYKIEDTIPYVNPSTGISYGWLVHYVSIVADTTVPYVAPSAEEAWQAQVAQYGVCGKFVYDSVNNTVRLPKITGFIEGASGVATLGDLVEAGLPNITGTFQVNGGRTSALVGTGCLADTYYSGGGYQGGSAGVAEQFYILSVDASRSSSVYGNSITVQPQATRILYYIVLATSEKTPVEVDIDEVVTDLNSKADRDLANTVLSSSFASILNAAGIRTVVETYKNGDSWYRVWSDGWCEQGGYVNNPVYHSSYTVNLLKSYADTTYFPTLTRVGAYDAGVWGSHTNFVSDITTNSFVIFTSSEGGGLGQVKWKTEGYLA